MIKLHITERCGAQPARSVHSLNWREGKPCTARDLIGARVSREFTALKPTITPRSLGQHLVQYPRHAGCTLKDAVGLALRGFELEAFFLVVDELHITEIDQPISLTFTSEVTFLRMLPKLAA